MIKRYEEKLPKWWNDRNKYDLVLTNDIDSLLSCVLLTRLKGWKIKYFYDFSYLYASKTLKGCKFNEKVYVDCSVIKGKCLDNHVNRLSKQDDYNKEMINPNILMGVTRDNYTDKYNLSTALMVWSLFNITLPKSEEGKMILLAIDGGYAGYYRGFRTQTFNYLVNVLNMRELYDCLSRHTEEEFKKIVKKYKLMGHIKFNEEGLLSTDIKLDKIGKALGFNILLPVEEYIKWKEYVEMDYKIRGENKKEEIETLEGIYHALFSIAVTYSKGVRYSLLVQPEWRI